MTIPLKENSFIWTRTSALQSAVNGHHAAQKTNKLNFSLNCWRINMITALSTVQNFHNALHHYFYDQDTPIETSEIENEVSELMVSKCRDSCAHLMSMCSVCSIIGCCCNLKPHSLNTSGRSPSVTFSHKPNQRHMRGRKHSVKHHLWLSIIVPRLKNGFWQQAICATQLRCSNAEFGITADPGQSQTPLSVGEIWWFSPKSHDQSFCPIYSQTIICWLLVKNGHQLNQIQLGWNVYF